jgi:branched-chain amino acid transport system substrate-binding protein
MAERGIDASKTKIMGQLEITDETALKNMGDAALGIITAGHYDWNHKSKANEEFVKAYNAEYHRNPDFFAIGAWDGMHAIYAALKKTNGNVDGEALVKAAEGMSWESPRGPVSIDPATRDIIQTVYIRKVEKVNGQLVNVDIDSIPNVKDPEHERAKK